MDKVLSPYKEKIDADKYSIHEILTLASIAEKEVFKSEDRKKVVSVFVNRLNSKTSLGSDITTRYALKVEDNATNIDYSISNPYNTRNTKNVGFIPSPICMISKDSLDATINRIETDYFYFISNIQTGETFFYTKNEDSNFYKKANELRKVNGGL